MVKIRTQTNMTDAQLKPSAVTGVNPGQKDQRNVQAQYMTAAILIGMPSLPRENCVGGRVSGWQIRRHRTEPMENMQH